MAKFLYPHGPKHPYEEIICRECGKRAIVRAYGKGFCSKSCAQKGKNNSAYWLGTAANYMSKHMRVYRARGKATKCAWGCLNQATYEWANLTGDYDDVLDFAEMCKRCHQRYDFARRTMEDGFVCHNGMRAKLTPEIVLEARLRRKAGEKLKDLASEYGVANSTLSLAINKKQWRYM